VGRLRRAVVDALTAVDAADARTLYRQGEAAQEILTSLVALARLGNERLLALDSSRGLRIRRDRLLRQTLDVFDVVLAFGDSESLRCRLPPA